MSPLELGAFFFVATVTLPRNNNKEAILYLFQFGNEPPIINCVAAIRASRSIDINSFFKKSCLAAEREARFFSSHRLNNRTERFNWISNDDGAGHP